jgi:hypothetical protein
MLECYIPYMYQLSEVTTIRSAWCIMCRGLGHMTLGPIAPTVAIPCHHIYNLSNLLIPRWVSGCCRCISMQICKSCILVQWALQVMLPSACSFIVYCVFRYVGYFYFHMLEEFCFAAYLPFFHVVTLCMFPSVFCSCAVFLSLILLFLACVFVCLLFLCLASKRRQRFIPQEDSWYSWGWKD